MGELRFYISIQLIFFMEWFLNQFFGSKIFIYFFYRYNYIVIFFVMVLALIIHPDCMSYNIITSQVIILFKTLTVSSFT